MVAYRIDPTDALPLHHQLQRQLRSSIRDGKLRPGDMLPPELQITQQTGLSRTTVRRAMDELVHEGLIVRERGRGTFVAQPRPPESGSGRIVVFAPPLDLPHHTAQLLSINLSTPEPVLGAPFGATYDRLLFITRLLQCDDGPCAVERLALPPLPWDAAKAAALADVQLLELAEETLGLRITHATVHIVPLALDRATAETLGGRTGAPALLVERCVYAGQRLLEHRRVIVHGASAGVELATPREMLLA